MKIKSVIYLLLSRPTIFNQIRKLIAGDQANTKNFVRKYLIKYKIKSVLDVGCGTGDFIEAVPDNMSYLGIDINKEFISFAKSHYKDRKSLFLVQDVIEEQFSLDQKFDATILISMLHHFSDKDLEEILLKIKKITRKVIIIADIIPNPPGLLRKFMVKMDQGNYIRDKAEKLKILDKYFTITESKIISSRLAVQFGIICKV